MTSEIKSKSKRYCSVPQCCNYVSETISIHQFPTNDKLKNMWKEALKIGKPISKHMSVCSDHFLPEDFSKNPNHVVQRRHLKKNVVPSQKIPTVSHPTKVTPSRHPPSNRSENSSKKVIAVDETALELENKSLNPRPSVSSFGQYREPLLDITFEDDRSENKKTLEDKAVQTNCDFQLPSILYTDKKLSTFTGIDYRMLTAIEKCIINIIEENGFNQVSSLRLKIILVLTKIKLNIPFSGLATLFGLTSTTCARYFHSTLKLIAEALKPAIIWPSKDQIRANLPICFNKYKNTRVILDCTEVSIQKFGCLRCKIKSYSHYKGGHTLKWLIGITPSGLISYVSAVYGGRASDKQIVLNENLISKCEPLDGIMVDKGFLIEKECEENLIKLTRPPFLKKNKQLSKIESETTAEIARARVHVERAIQRLKMYKVLNSKIETRMIPSIDDIMLVVAALVNLSSPILADEKFDN